MIVAAAIKSDSGVILSLPEPARHHHILRQMDDLGLDAIELGHPEAQGFLTSGGHFVDREEARCIAVAMGQVKPHEATHPTELFSEDLW